ncbi:putative phytanoyldioxygenase [Diaporthe ampelina]|uniref:Putative phytanoyldioxygenase n=1 Tax=Diaporthe ampelina TaxID=1214573 RepID=A0A0G2FVL9_9PEZI|nr:putative phytanoyldioxygenase [Diaporthe ampelina]
MGGSSPDWQLQLERDGFVVLPNRVSAEDCAEFREQALSWLEKFPHGFKRDDRSTWTSEHLPYSVTGGLYNRYSIGHEAFVWKIRSQPKILEAFAQLWGTDDLIASFDGINITLPINEETGRTDIKPTGAWPHMDQNPRNHGRFELYQGIANLAPNGPQDGGLCVLRGSHLLHEEHFAAKGGFRPEQDSGERENGYNFTAGDADWYRARGCEEAKVCAGEGDLILWDSRLIHWNASPVGARVRFAAYVCYCPRALMDEAGLARKLEVFRARKSTTHWPQQNVVPVDRKDRNAVPRRPDGSPDQANRTRPFLEPEETPDVLRLVGVRA